MGQYAHRGASQQTTHRDSSSPSVPHSATAAAESRDGTWPYGNVRCLNAVQPCICNCSITAACAHLNRTLPKSTRCCAQLALSYVLDRTTGCVRQQNVYRVYLMMLWLGTQLGGHRHGRRHHGIMWQVGPVIFLFMQLWTRLHTPLRAAQRRSCRSAACGACALGRLD